MLNTPIKKSAKRVHFSFEKFCRNLTSRSIMAQAAVDIQAQNIFRREPSYISHRRRSSDDDSSFDEDPSWQPSDFKPKKKRRCTDAHRPQVRTAPHSPVASTYSCEPNAGVGDIKVELTKINNDLWENFRSLGTEMIICKEGRSVAHGVHVVQKMSLFCIIVLVCLSLFCRRMFPAVEIVIKGLQPDYIYSVFISTKLKDQCRYRYNTKTGWTRINAGAQPSIPYRMVPHADSRNTGSYLMRKPLSFKTIKMTNNLNTKRDDQV